MKRNTSAWIILGFALTAFVSVLPSKGNQVWAQRDAHAVDPKLETLMKRLFPKGEMWAQAEVADERPEIEILMDRLFPEGENEVEQLEQRMVDFSGPEDRPALYEVLEVNKKNNPLLTEDCRRDAARNAVVTLRDAKDMDDEAAFRMALKHTREIQAKVMTKGISYADYLKHIVECKDFCRPLVAHLIHCHVASVANHEHGIVLFDYDSDQVRGYAARGVIADVVRRLSRDSERKVLLVGRASRTGQLRYNKLLSGRRALAVSDVLMEKGVHPKRIKAMWFGWEEPQIDDWIAGEYGLGDEFPQLGKRQMNQSVMMVIY